MTATVTTTKQVALGQLSREIRTRLSMLDDGTTRIISGDVDQAALQAAVDKHAPDLDPTVADSNRRAVETAVADALTSLRTTIDGATTIANKANADIGPADIKDLARGLRATARVTLRLCRVAVNRYEATE